MSVEKFLRLIEGLRETGRARSMKVIGSINLRAWTKPIKDERATFLSPPLSLIPSSTAFR